MNNCTAIEADESLFREFLVSKGLRITIQRIAVFIASVKQENHFTAEELLTRAKSLDSTVSRATVYRTLPLLIENAIIREIDIGKDYKYYILNHKSKTFQTQVVCSDCERIFEIDAPFMEWYGRSVSNKLDMGMESQRLQITAHCLEKKKKGLCGKRYGQ